MLDSFQRFIPLFENYLKADNQQQFIQHLHDPNQKKIIQILANQITNVKEYEKQLQEIRINPRLQTDLVQLKLTNYIQNAKNMNDDEIRDEIKMRFSRKRFDYPKPQTMSANDPMGQKEDLTPTKLQVQNNLQNYLNQKLREKASFIRSLNDYGISRVNTKQLLRLPLIEQDYLLQKCGIIYHFDEKFIAEFLIGYEKQKRKTNKSYRLTSKILQNLTKLQINYLGSVDKKMFENEDFIQLWFNLNFSQRITKYIQNGDQLTKLEHLNKRDQFLKIIQELKNQNHSIIHSYIDKFKAEIMLIDIIVDDPSLQRLVDYLKTNKSVLLISQITYEYRDQVQKIIKNDDKSIIEPKMRYALDIDRTIVDNFINDYLQKLFTNQESQKYIDQLATFINRNHLLKMHAKARISMGQKVDYIHNYLNSEELQRLKELKYIRFCKMNKKKWRPNDQVQLEVSIKNVQRIDVKIYSLSLEKHLLNSSEEIDDDINLSFLKPEHQYIYQNVIAKTNPFAVVNTTLKIDTKHIPKRMGVFIIDLQGDTVTSRAVIRKGAILCLESFTQAGHKFSFYDQTGRPLTQQDGLKVWLSGKPRILHEKNNYFFVDYVQKNQWTKIVASVGSYAEQFEKELKTEHYKFQVGYIYNNQSFIVGKKAKIGLHGRLTMNNCSMSLQLLQNIKVKVSVTNNQQISTFYSFNFDKWSNKQDQLIEFPIQSYTSNISIWVEAKVTLQSKKELAVSHSKDIKINLGQNTQNFMDIYLQKDRTNNYILNLLGLNGQNIANTDIVLTYSVTGVEEIEKTKVKTDSEGKVHLGQLSIVKQLTAEANCYQTTVERRWRLDKTELGVNYTNVIYVKVGQEITLPVDPSWKQEDYVFLRTFDKYFAEDISSQIKLDKSRIILPTIKNEGYYVLKILPIDKQIQIITLKDYKWQGDNDQNQKVYDQNSAKIYDINRNIYQNVNILNVKQTKLENTTQIEVQLNLQGLKEEKYKNVRVHALATNFVPNETRQIFKAQSFNVQPQLNQYYMRFKSSAYYNNKTLSDQGAYVWKRQKNGERIIGNNLQKPGIFLKRILVRQTNQQNENLEGQVKYIEECALTRVDPNLRQRVVLKKYKKENTNPEQTLFNSHNNFLSLSGHLDYNLNGQTVTFEVPNNYNNVQLLILTPSTAITRHISLGNTQNKNNKDLRHVGMVDSNNTKGSTMSRQVYELQTGEQMTINRNSLWRTVTLSDIFQFANAKRISLYDWNSHLLSWSTYDLNKKKQIYDKQTCHQLNTFLYFQDKKFFEQIIRPFINNKINKTFVDLCLLGDKKIRQFANINKLSNLNAFQKVLLVHSLVCQSQFEIASKITKKLTLQQGSIKRNYEQFKNNFDTIINAKQPQKPKQKGKQISLGQRRQQLEMFRKKREYTEQYECGMYVRSKKMQQKKSFIPVQSTKQYTQRTYYNVKNYKSQAPHLVSSSAFWAELAQHLLTGKQTHFLSKQFMTLKSGIQFILAACFISSESSANFDVGVIGQNYKIKAKSPMLLYVKQVKQLQFASKFGVQINQRFIDPLNMHTYEDGLKVQKQVEEFVVNKPYIAQTVVTNTSGAPLQLQILLDIPKGTIPLQSHQYTQIVNIILKEYSSREFKRVFYAPQQGQYRIYPSNACRGSTIIAKADQKPEIIVKKYLTINKLQSFDDILRSGNKQIIIDFLENKNIFDSNVFDPISILWMLKDKNFYSSIIKILRERKYYNADIWNFAFYHQDLETIKQVVDFKKVNLQILQPAIFEYFPYYSTRTHQFANQTKSTIRNVQFKESYLKLLTSSVVGIQDKATFYVAFAYYLILQDRLKQADAILDRIVKEYPQCHQIQVDYMRCFLDISLNPPNFSVARQIILKYKNYPISSWKKLFDEVRYSLQAQDQDFDEVNDFKRSEEFQTKVIQEADQFKIIQPADTAILVQFFEINLEVLFSDYPFYDYKTFTAVKPSQSKLLSPSSETKQIIIRRKDYLGIRDATVQITQTKDGLPPKKVSTFEWINSQLKVKINENSGTLQVFLNKKKHSGAYVKVFCKKRHLEQFYRDGYTDMTGNFRYAMSDLQGISEFSILVSTEKGGVIQKVKPPSKLANY